MSKPNFRLCEKRATELLAKQNITSTKIDVQHLKYDKTIVFDTIQNYAESTDTPIKKFINEKTKLLSEGCTLTVDDNIFIVLYNDKPQISEHLNWTLAHEIGHIYLGHKCDSKKEEIEAHFFAACLLMPEYVIYMISNLYNVNVNENDIRELFYVSKPAAENRKNTHETLRYFNTRLYVSQDDKKIWSMMEPCIKDYYFYANCSQEFKRFLSMPIIDV